MSGAECESLVADLMRARAAIRIKRRNNDTDKLGRAKLAVNEAKVAPGERGRVWWTDGSRDLNRHMANTTRYADWLANLPSGS